MTDTDRGARTRDPCDPYVTLAGHSMGTTWTVRCAPVQRERLAVLRAALVATLQETVDQMSTWDPHSTLSRLNQSAPGWYQVPTQLFGVLDHALHVAQATQGAFDPTIGELVQLWGFGPAGPVHQPPSEATVATAMARSGWRRTQLNATHHGVWQPGGVQFDLSSIAKGYGVDCMADVLDAHDVAHYLIELGGEIRVRGHNPQGSGWKLDIESPDTKTANLPLSLSDTALATSGDYRRCFHHNGHRYAHTIDPRTGHPLRNDLASVTVLQPSCMQADAQATALLCLGLERGMAYACEHDIAALFMTRQDDEIAVEWTPRFIQAAQARTLT